MQTTQLKDLNKLKEKYFMRRLDGKTVYLVNHYERSCKKYSISPVDDMNKEIFVSGNKTVFIGFTY
jgi:hypothetical protein